MNVSYLGANTSVRVLQLSYVYKFYEENEKTNILSYEIKPG